MIELNPNASELRNVPPGFSVYTDHTWGSSIQPSLTAWNLSAKPLANRFGPGDRNSFCLWVVTIYFGENTTGRSLAINFRDHSSLSNIVDTVNDMLILWEPFTYAEMVPIATENQFAAYVRACMDCEVISEGNFEGIFVEPEEGEEAPVAQVIVRNDDYPLVDWFFNPTAQS